MSAAPPNFLKIGQINIMVTYSGVTPLCRKCLSENHSAKDCTATICAFCHSENHMIENCEKVKAKERRLKEREQGLGQPLSYSEAMQSSRDDEAFPSLAADSAILPADNNRAAAITADQRLARQSTSREERQQELVTPPATTLDFPLSREDAPNADSAVQQSGSAPALVAKEGEQPATDGTATTGNKPTSELTTPQVTETAAAADAAAAAALAQPKPRSPSNTSREDADSDTASLKESDSQGPSLRPHVRKSRNKKRPLSARKVTAALKPPRQSPTRMDSSVDSSSLLIALPSSGHHKRGPPSPPEDDAKKNRTDKSPVKQCTSSICAGACHQFQVECPSSKKTDNSK